MPSIIEVALAAAAVDLLRSAHVSDSEILQDYTKPSPLADTAYEECYWQEFGVWVEAREVKAEMRRLVAS